METLNRLWKRMLSIASIGWVAGKKNWTELKWKCAVKQLLRVLEGKFLHTSTHNGWSRQCLTYIFKANFTFPILHHAYGFLLLLFCYSFPKGPQGSVDKPFLWTEGRVNLKASLNKSAYTHGENVNVTIDVKNDSRKVVRKIRVSFNLLKRINNEWENLLHLEELS